MKTEMKAVVASLVVIALALAAVSGVTYSWFSDEEKSTIDVSTANIDIDGKYTGTPDMTGPYTSAEFVNNDKDLKIGGMVAGSSVTATYTLTNNSTVDVKYRMYLVVEGIDSATANGIVSITGDIESTSASPISFDSKGIAYVFGGKDFGIVLGSASGEPVIYPFTVKIALDTSLTSLPGFTVKIVNEAYQSDFEYSEPNFIKSDGSSALPKDIVSKDVTFKGTVPAAPTSSAAEPADAEVTFSPAAMNAATADGANDVTLKTEMLEPEGNIAKIRLTLVGAATTSFGADNWVTVSLKLSGEYTNVKVTYIGGEEQPVLISAAYDSDKDITTVVFKTNHFSEFVISNGAIVSTFDALKAAVEKGENVILDQDITFTSTVNIPAGKSVIVDFNGHTVTSEFCLFYMEPKTGSTLTINAVGSVVSAERIFSNYPAAKDPDGSYNSNKVQTASLIMNGGNYTTTNLGLLIFSMKYIELNDVDITSGAYATIWSGNSGVTDIVINGGKFVTKETEENSENVGIYLGSVRNSAKIVGSDIEGFVGLEIKSGKTVTVEGCTIVGLGDYSEPMNINNNGSGSGVAPVMINNGYCNAAGITDGTMDVKFTSCTIKYSGSSSNLEVIVVEKVGGIGIDAIVGKENINCDNEYSVGGVTFKTNAEKDNVAYVDGTKFFDSLTEAFASITDGDNHIITVLKDSTGSGVAVESGKKISVNFNGCVYTVHKPTVGSTGTETNGFQLKKDSNIIFMNGKLNSADAKILIQNYCNLTLDGMVLDGTNLVDSNSYTLSNNNGTILIKDTTIIAKTGGVAFDIYGNFGSYDGPMVTIAGSSKVVGTIEFDVQKTTTDADKNVVPKKVSGTQHSLTIEGGEFSKATLKIAGHLSFSSIVIKNNVLTSITGGTLKEGGSVEFAGEPYTYPTALAA